MIFVVGGGGGSGKLSGRNHPTIHVNVPLNSTIEFIFGGQVIDTILSSEQIPNQDGETADYYYAANFLGEWNIHIYDLAEGEDQTDNILLIANRLYHVALSYKTYLVQNSVFKASFTKIGYGRIYNGNHFGATDTDMAQYYTPYTITKEKTMRIVCPKVWSVYSANAQPSIYIRTNIPSSRSDVSNTSARGMLNKGSTSRICKVTNVTTTVDISSLSPGKYYVGIYYGGYQYTDGSLPAADVDIEVTSWYLS